MAKTKMSNQARACLRYLLAALSLGLLAHRAFAASFALPPPGSDIVGQVRVIIAHRRDTLLDIARRYDLGYKEIKEANPHVDAWLPGEGTRVTLPTQFILPDAPRRGIVLNLPAMRLYYYPVPKPGERAIVITHPIAIGRVNWSIHTGLTRITDKIANPVWYIPESIKQERALEGQSLPKFVPAGPNNPLGQYAMRLGIADYLIHGTNKPYGIGSRVSHGCIHLYPEDIATLFKQVPIGTQVNIVNQPFLAGWLEENLYVQAHQPMEEDIKAWRGSLTPLVEAIVKRARPPHPTIDWETAINAAQQARSLPVRVSLPIHPTSTH